MVKVVRKKLGEILLEEGLVTKEQLQEALNLQQKTKDPKPLGETLIGLGYLSEEGLCLSISRKLGIKYLSLADGSLNISFDQGLDKLIDERVARSNMVLPLSKTLKYLSVAVWDPLNFVVIDNIKKIARMDLLINCTTKSDILIGIDRLYLHKGVFDTKESVMAGQAAWRADEETIDELKSKAAEAPVIKMVNLMMQDAVKEKASDIHVEPQEEKVVVRFRVDGILYEKSAPSKNMIAPLVSRIKILSHLDIAEKRLPQDGGFMAKIDKRNIDFRVSTIPTIYGEKLTIRILDKEQVNFNLSTINLNKEDQEKVSSHIHKPNGLVFLTGPTGSGKTTTLYCLLNEIKSPEKNIITIEDPVEYRISGANQVQAMPQIGLDFARGLRTFLRQDPDIIMVGEVRDLETAEICVRSALVGRLVLSTLHTNDSVGSISRLLDFGIESFLLASTLNMIIAQRLVRKLCPQCKELVKLDAKTVKDYKLEGTKTYKPKGCDACHKRGFMGRVAIFEIMCVDRDIRAMIEKKEDMSSVKKFLVEKKGMKTLRQDGLEKVRAGLTSLDEVLATTMDLS